MLGLPNITFLFIGVKSVLQVCNLAVKCHHQLLQFEVPLTFEFVDILFSYERLQVKFYGIEEYLTIEQLFHCFPSIAFRSTYSYSWYYLPARVIGRVHMGMVIDF